MQAATDAFLIMSLILTLNCVSPSGNAPKKIEEDSLITTSSIIRRSVGIKAVSSRNNTFQ